MTLSATHISIGMSISTSYRTLAQFQPVAPPPPPSTHISHSTQSKKRRGPCTAEPWLIKDPYDYSIYVYNLYVNAAGPGREGANTTQGLPVRGGQSNMRISCLVRHFRPIKPQSHLRNNIVFE